MDYRVGGTEISSKGKIVIQKMISGKKILIEESGLSKREWNELMTTFELREKIVE
jgi:thymidylate synthase (FAD)